MTYYPPDTESGKHSFILQETLIQKKKKERERMSQHDLFFQTDLTFVWSIMTK